MTPMLDIVFILLIFFIVTASFIKETGLIVNHPPHSLPTPPTAPKEVIGFQVDANNHVFFEGRHVDYWGAEAIIKEQTLLYPEAPVVVALTKGAKLKTMVRLYDAALKNGVPKGQIAVTTSP